MNSMKCQREKFSFESGVAYINGANMSPILKSSESIGRDAMVRGGNPPKVSPDFFFEPIAQIKRSFSKLINCDWQRIAVMPSTAYGISTVIKNISLRPEQNIVLLEGQFTSNVYPWMKLAEKTGASIRMITPPDAWEDQGSLWTERILESIDAQTAVVSMGMVHWTDGQDST